MSFGSASAHQVDKLVLNQSDDALLPLRAYQKQQSPVAGQTWSLQDLERWPTSLWAFTAASVALLTIEGTLAPRQSTRDAFRNTASQQASIALSLAAYPAITAFFARGEDGQSTFAPAVQHALKLFRSLRHWRRIGIAFLLLFGLAISGVFASRHATSALRASFFVSVLPFVSLTNRHHGNSRFQIPLAAISVSLSLAYFTLDVSRIGALFMLAETVLFYLSVDLFSNLALKNALDMFTTSIPAFMLSACTFTILSLDTIFQKLQHTPLGFLLESNPVPFVSDFTAEHQLVSIAHFSSLRIVFGILEVLFLVKALQPRPDRFGGTGSPYIAVAELRLLMITRAFIAALLDEPAKNGQILVRVVLFAASTWYISQQQSQRVQASTLNCTPTVFEEDEEEVDEVEKAGALPGWSLARNAKALLVPAAALALFGAWLFSVFFYQIQRSTASAAQFQTDIVIAYYEESFENLNYLTEIIGNASTLAARPNKARFIIYTKSDKVDPALLLQQSNIDKVVALPNIGRESHTYLYHIVHNWDKLADQTLFFQDHIAWDGIPQERLEMLSEKTGFMHLGKHTKITKTLDEGNGLHFPRLADYWHIFQETFVPNEPHLGGWSAQMAVSKKRIRAVPLGKWLSVLRLFEAESDSWIHDLDQNQSGLNGYKGGFGQTNPYFGHAMERSWPVAFNCTSISIFDKCNPGVASKPQPFECQCLDE